MLASAKSSENFRIHMVYGFIICCIVFDRLVVNRISVNQRCLFINDWADSVTGMEFDWEDVIQGFCLEHTRWVGSAWVIQWPGLCLDGRTLARQLGWRQARLLKLKRGYIAATRSLTQWTGRLYSCDSFWWRWRSLGSKLPWDSWKKMMTILGYHCKCTRTMVS